MSTKKKYVFRKWTLRLFAHFLDSIGYFFFHPPEKKTIIPKKLLVIRLDQMGDVLQTRSLLSSLRSSFPDAEIHFLTTSVGSAVNSVFGMAEHVHIWDCQWFDKKRKANKTPFDIFLWLKKQKFDCVFELRGDLRLIALLKLSGARNIVGNGSTGGGFLLDIEVPWDPTIHEIDKNLAFLNAIGAVNSDSTTISSIAPKNELSKRIAVHPDAGASSKKWPILNFVEVIMTLLAKGQEVVLVGLDSHIGAEIAGFFPAGVDNKMGKTTIQDLVSILKSCQGLLTNDSGPAHLMSALGKPVWIVWSGTAEATVWAPRAPDVRVISHAVPCAPCSLSSCPIPNHPCLTSISPERVVQTMLGAL